MHVLVVVNAFSHVVTCKNEMSSKRIADLARSVGMPTTSLKACIEIVAFSIQNSTKLGYFRGWSQSLFQPRNSFSRVDALLAGADVISSNRALILCFSSQFSTRWLYLNLNNPKTIVPCSISYI